MYGVNALSNSSEWIRERGCVSSNRACPEKSPRPERVREIQRSDHVRENYLEQRSVGYPIVDRIDVGDSRVQNYPSR